MDFDSAKCSITLTVLFLTIINIDIDNRSKQYTRECMKPIRHVPVKQTDPTKFPLGITCLRGSRSSCNCLASKSLQLLTLCCLHLSQYRVFLWDHPFFVIYKRVDVQSFYFFDIQCTKTVANCIWIIMIITESGIKPSSGYLSYTGSIRQK